MHHAWLHCHAWNIIWNSEGVVPMSTYMVDLTWLMIVGTTSTTNFLKLTKVKFFKVWNNLGVVCSVVRMSPTLTFGSINWLTFGTILVMVKNSSKLAMVTEVAWNNMKASTSMSSMNSTLNPSKFKSWRC